MTNDDENSESSASEIGPLLDQIKSRRSEIAAEDKAVSIIAETSLGAEGVPQITVLAHLANVCDSILRETLGQDLAEQERTRAREFQNLYRECLWLSREKHISTQDLNVVQLRKA